MKALVEIARIQDLKAIPEYDRIVEATVNNYSVIVRKEEFETGDLCVYVREDTILPELPEFEFLRSRCYSKKYKGFRIRPMKMAGIISFGIVLPMSILSGESYSEGQDVTEDIGAWEHSFIQENKTPPIKRSFIDRMLRRRGGLRKRKHSFKTKENGFPICVPKSDQENIQRLWDKYGFKEYLSKKVFQVTEKMEGASTTFVVSGKLFPKLYIYSHNNERDIKDGSWWSVAAKQLNIKEKMLSIRKDWALQGELIGPGIQKNIYGLDDFDFLVYGVFDLRTGEKVPVISWPEKDFERVGINTVPEISRMRFDKDISLKEVVNFADGVSLYFPDVPREGIVVQNLLDPHDSFKVKSKEYAIWFEEGKKKWKV